MCEIKVEALLNLKTVNTSQQSSTQAQEKS
jgi:hypothetical protein